MRQAGWIAVALLASGCASVPRDAGVSEVQKRIEEQGLKVAWTPDQPIELEELVPGYMPMGTTGVGDMMDMGKPRNTLLMGWGEGPFGSIFMGGMFTILKIRENLRSYDEDPGWYDYPEGTVASAVSGPQAAAPAPRPHRLAVPPRTFDAVKPAGGHGSHGRR